MAGLSSNTLLTLTTLKITGQQYIRGQGNTPVSLYMYPSSNLIVDDNDEAQIAWDEWWQLTTWATQPEGDPPRWASSTRTGKIWLRYGEGAHCLTGRPHVFCLNCGAILQHPLPTKIGTKHLMNHLATQSCMGTMTPVHNLVQTPFAPFSRQQQGSTPITAPHYNPLALEKELVRVVIANNWSFRTVERSSFRRFLQFLRPETVLITRYKFSQMFLSQFQEAKAALVHNLGPNTKVSFALDGWSAANHLSFLAVKGYYIDSNWNLNEKLLDFIPLRGQHTGASMASDTLQVLLDTGLESRLLAITCDNASNNTVLTRSVQRGLAAKAIYWSSAENTIPCLAHVINLVVQDIIQHLKLAATEEVDARDSFQRRHVQDIAPEYSVPNSLRKLRAICLAIDVSPQRFERFMATQHQLPAQEQLSVIRDVKTRWNSTYDMCARAIKLSKFIDEWLNQEIALKSNGRPANNSTQSNNTEVDSRDLKRLRLSSVEWHHLEVLTNMLKRFKTATSFLSENYKPQIQYIWLMYNRLFDFIDTMTEDLEEASEDQQYSTWPAVVQAAAEKGREKMKKYYAKTEDEQGFLFNCATILDPTQKLTVYEDESWEAHWKHVYRQQFLNYLDRYDSSESSRSTQSSTPLVRRSQGDEWFRKPASASRGRSSSISTPNQSCSVQEADDVGGQTRQEGESYLSIPCVIAGDAFNILEWWQQNETTYPRLSQVAKDILAIPIAGVGVERVFNVAKDIIGDRRHRLSARTLQQIMVLRDSICQATEGTSDDSVDVPSDEAYDLFALQAPIKSVEEEMVILDEEPSNDVLIEQESPLPPHPRPQPPRKRMRPARFRDDEE